MSAQRFMVTGLPRSRTAWLSVLLTGERSMCYHEPSSRMSELSDLFSIYAQEYYDYVGVADSGLGFFIDRILEEFAPRTLIVERPLSEVEQSLAEFGLPASNYCELLKEKLEAVSSHPLVMRVPFGALDDWRWVQQIHWHLVPGLNFDETRFHELAKMQIETDAYKTSVIAFENRQQIGNLMRDVYPMIRFKRSDAHQIH